MDKGRIHKELLCALIGLSRAVEGNEAKCSEQTHQLLLQGLALLVPTMQPADSEGMKRQIAALQEEKARLAPRCLTCPKQCGRNDDFPMEQLPRLFQEGNRLAESIVSIGMFLTHPWISADTRQRAVWFLYEALLVWGKQGEDGGGSAPDALSDIQRRAREVSCMVLTESFVK